MEKVEIVPVLISECRKALEQDMLFIALAVALTLPDICAKAQYPGIRNNKEVYTKWFDENIGQYEKCPCDHCKESPMPYLSGEVIYSLRCNMLHQGTPNVDLKQITAPENQIDEFVLEIDKHTGLYNSGDSCGIEQFFNGKEFVTTNRHYRINVRNFCWKICRIVENYYRENKELFNFIQFSTIDKEEELSKLGLPSFEATEWYAIMQEGLKK